MKLSTKLFALTLIPLLCSMLLCCLIVYQVMNTTSTRQLAQVRSDQEEIISKGLKGRVETAWSIVEECYKRGTPQDECKQYMNTVRFGDNNYLWVHRMDPGVEGSAFMIVHPDTSLVNLDMSGTIDFDRFKRLYYRGQIYKKTDPAVSHINPTRIFREFNAVCLKQGEGVVDYYRPKIINGKGGDVGYHKISYVKLFKPWNWVLGAGEYADYIENMISIKKEEIIQEQRTIYITIFCFFAGIGLFFVVLACVVSKKVADNLDRSKQNLLNSQKKLKHSEKRFMDMALCSADFIWEVDRQWNYSFVTGNTEHILGYAATELIGKNPCTFMVEEEIEEAKTRYMRLAEEKRPIIDHKIRCRSKAGEIVFLLRNASPIIDQEGVVTGYLGVDRVITDQVREEEKRKTLERELQVSQKLEAIGTLAAGIAHEINTPIQFIGDNATFISENIVNLFKAFRDLKEITLPSNNENETLKKVVDEIEEKYDFEFLATEIPLSLLESMEGIGRVSDIIRTMKDFSFMGSGSLAKEDINNAIETTITISRNEWKYVAEMKTEFDNELPLVSCFIGDIKQVILNLIINASHTIQDAISARNESMGCITIRTCAHEKFAVIEIFDTGMGIPEESQDRVFEHFFTSKGVGKGTGQGLSMAYQTIVEKHKGEISFTTEAGKGTTFTIKLPFDLPEL